MTAEEARKVCEILSEAHGGCSHCAYSLFDMFVKNFPEHAEIALEVFTEYFGENDEDGWVDCLKSSVEKIIAKRDSPAPTPETFPSEPSSDDQSSDEEAQEPDETPKNLQWRYGIATAYGALGAYHSLFILIKDEKGRIVKEGIVGPVHESRFPEVFKKVMTELGFPLPPEELEDPINYAFLHNSPFRTDPNEIIMEVWSQKSNKPKGGKTGNG